MPPEGHLAELFDSAGLRDLEESSLAVRVEHTTFEKWWEPYTLGVAPQATTSPARPETPRRAT